LWDTPESEGGGDGKRKLEKALGKRGENLLKTEGQAAFGGETFSHKMPVPPPIEGEDSRNGKRDSRSVPLSTSFLKKRKKRPKGRSGGLINL